MLDPIDRRDPTAFYDTIQRYYRTADPIQWFYFLTGVMHSSDEVLTKAAKDMGFVWVEIQPVEDQEGALSGFTLCVGEERVHSPQSFLARVADLDAFATQRHLSLKDFSASVTKSLG